MMEWSSVWSQYLCIMYEDAIEIFNSVRVGVRMFCQVRYDKNFIGILLNLIFCSQGLSIERDSGIFIENNAILMSTFEMRST